MHKGINIIFLDVDGVLNCYDTIARCGPYVGIDEEKVKLLKEIVIKTKAYLVLISTWKEMWFRSPKQKHNQDFLANYLDKILAKYDLRIIEKTREIDPFERGRGIIDYLDVIKRKGVKVNNFIILDDLVFDYAKTGLKNHLVKTDPKTGLLRKHVDLAIFLMNATNEIHKKI